MTREEEAEVREVMQEVIANVNQQIIDITDGRLRQKLLGLANKHGWGARKPEESK
jgi:hypothetical protein